MSTAEEGAALARRHEERLAVIDGDLPPTLLDVAERARVGDWSLRAALVRVAQFDPNRVSAVLELIRRTDGALHPVRRALERHLVSGGGNGDGGVDIRAGDLARHLVSTDAPDELLAGYESITTLDDPERDVLGVLQVAAGLDALGDRLAVWAERLEPLDVAAEIDAVARPLFDALGLLGVPRETAPPPGRRR